MAQILPPYPKPNKREVEAYYDATANSYDSLYADEQKAKYVEALRLLSGKVEGAVLDAGCGTGLLFQHLTGAKTIVGADLSRRMLEIAKRKGRNRNVHLVRCDVENLPFRDSVFQACFLFTVAQNLPNPFKAFKELSRVSGRQATLVLTLMDEDENRVRDAIKLAGLKLALKSKVRRESIIAGFKA